MLLDAAVDANGLYPYLDGLAGAGDDVLVEMEQYAARRRFPIVGPLVGRLLTQLAMLSDARRVLELGSGFGYSAAWWLQASPEVHVTCTDASPLNRGRALDFLGRLGVADRVAFHVGDALDIAAGVPPGFDVVFCDLDKRLYPRAFEVALPLLRHGGVFVADNALWRGFVWAGVPDGAPAYRHEALPGVRELNRTLHARSDVMASIVPLRDGVALAVKR